MARRCSRRLAAGGLHGVGNGQGGKRRVGGLYVARRTVGEGRSLGTGGKRGGEEGHQAREGGGRGEKALAERERQGW